MSTDRITVSDHLNPVGKNDFYVGQRAPLAPSPFQKLPPGSIRATGWLGHQLELERKGFSGQLPKLSQFLNPKNNAWLGNSTSARAGWEELPYWLRGEVSLAYVTGDKGAQQDIQKWFEGVLASQREDGWFGPLSNRDTKLGTPDLWPNMLMQAALETYYDASGDQRVLQLLTRYVEYLDGLSEEATIDPRHYWHYHRVSDQLSSLIWLYNNTGNPKILRVAEKFHRHSSNWTAGIPNFHGVNFAQGFREPALYSIFSRVARQKLATERNLDEFRAKWGLPAGLYAADENARVGKNDPRQAVESCTVAEMMMSDEELLLTTGDPIWGERAEEVAFNWMPTTMTADLKALRYLTSANMAVSDAPSKSPGVENGGPMFLMDPWDHRCCQHNIGMAWPYLTEHLWMATNGNGLAAVIYSASKVTAKVGDGTKVAIETLSNYPFSESLTFKVDPQKQVRFPLSFRIPSWTKAPRLSVNGKFVKTSPVAGKFITVDRVWRPGDTVRLTLPMVIRTEQNHDRKNTLTVYRGPLGYSLKIGERVSRYGRTKDWPSYEIYPTTAWNYGLVENPKFKVLQGHMTDQPWTFSTAPISLQTQGRKIPEWGLDMYGLVSPLQSSPAQTTQPVETLTLIPMGAARLRITVFPTVVPRGGTTWVKAKAAPKKSIPATYSFRNWFDSEAALSDGLIPSNSGDQEIPRFTWWDHKGTEEWVQYSFGANRTFQGCRVYWFDDDKDGLCRVPAAWRVQVKVGSDWKDVEADGPYPVIKNGWSQIKFKPVAGTQIRLVVKLQPEFSSGILEWELD